MEQTIVNAGFDPLLIVKYVDDILMFGPRDEIENFLQLLNSYCDEIQFTLEIEENNSIPYLDMLIHRCHDGTLITELYQKPTSKNRLLNYHSAHPFAQKSGMAYGMISRILSITSPQFREKSISKIFDILISNNYPKKLIQNLIHKYCSKSSNQMISNGEIVTVYRSLLYVPKLSENLQHLFTSFNKNIKLGMKPFSTTRKILPSKTNKYPTMGRHGVVYIFDCNNCDGQYIGETGRKLSDRIKEHIYDSKHKHKDISNQTAAVQHIINTGHSFNYEDAQILITESNKTKRRILESIFINKHSNTSINLRNDLQSLNPTFLQILKNL